MTRVMSALLFGIQPLDWVTHAAVAVGLALTALVVTYLPAMRAARVDAAVALRWDA
jgi:ABC-type lipoprotein release transport system permease subunit